MTQVAEVMTRGVRSMMPGDSLQLAAQAMDELNVGVIPVCDGDQLIGMVTDRDITVRGVAQGLPADSTPIREVMSENVRCVFEDQSIDEATAQMQSAQVRRLPVLDREKRLVGILALGDVAAKTDDECAGEALSNISEPAEPDRSSQSA
ncbi:MAG: CBS domain-containing protein, partial [Rubrivivax sp.]